MCESRLKPWEQTTKKFAMQGNFKTLVHEEMSFFWT